MTIEVKQPTGLILYTENQKVIFVEFDKYTCEYVGQPFEPTSGPLNKFYELAYQFREPSFVLDIILNGVSVLDLSTLGTYGSTAHYLLEYLKPKEIYNRQVSCNYDFLSRLTSQDFRRTGDLFECNPIIVF